MFSIGCWSEAYRNEIQPTRVNDTDWRFMFYLFMCNISLENKVAERQNSKDEFKIEIHHPQAVRTKSLFIAQVQKSL